MNGARDEKNIVPMWWPQGVDFAVRDGGDRRLEVDSWFWEAMGSVKSRIDVYVAQGWSVYLSSSEVGEFRMCMQHYIGEGINCRCVLI